MSTFIQVNNLEELKRHNIHHAKKTLYKWRYIGSYPGLFSKVGNKLFIDADKYKSLMEAGRVN